MLHTSPHREKERRVNQGQQSLWRIARRWALWIGCIVLTLALVISLYGGYRYGWKWTGLVKDADFPRRTLWDWLKLLIIPAVIAGGTIWFNRRQQERSERNANQRAQDEALDAYLDDMTELLTDKDRPLHRARSPEPLSTVAWARTKTVLRRIDGARRGIVVRFVYESGLIYKGQRVFDLAEANLRGADLRESWLECIDLEGTDLSSADLRGAHLRGANLRGAHLRGAKLRGADLTKVDLGVAEETDQAADLTGADLSDVYKRAADGSRQTITNEELWQQTKSLNGATMPDGQKYEDWLKSKDRGEDGENSGLS
jgi:hypothetical protein